MYLEMKEHNVSIFKQLRTNGVRCACVCVRTYTHTDNNVNMAGPDEG